MDFVDKNFLGKNNFLVVLFLGVNLKIPTYDGRFLPFKTDKIINPTSYKKFPGAGLPTKKGGKGNLVVFFDVQFPKSLDKNQKRVIKNEHWGYPKDKSEL